MKKNILTITCLLWISGFANGFCALTEPESILFGKITNHYYGYEQTIYHGILEWQIKGQNEAFLFTTALESLANGKYSYKLNIPEKAAVIIPKHLEVESVSNSILLESKEKQYDHIKITVNGLNARIKEPDKAFMMASQRKRGQAIQIDLVITDPPPDTDNDGIPDFWESKFGFDMNQAADAAVDSDHDGWNTLEEFKKGTDPFTKNTVPGLLESDTTFYATEFGKSLLSIKIMDSDTPPENIQISLVNEPTCGKLMFKGNPNQTKKADTKLNIDTLFSAKQIQDGWIYYTHMDLCLEDQFMIDLWDQDTAHSAQQYTINIKVRTISSTDTVLWADIHHQSLSQEHLKSISIINDRSGNNNHLMLASSVMGILQPDQSDNTKQSLLLDQTCYRLSPWSQLIQSNELTVFAVFQQFAVNQNQSIFSTSTNEATSKNSWNIDIKSQNNNFRIFQANKSIDRVVNLTNESNDIYLGSQIDDNTQLINSFHGLFGELILFNKSLSNEEIIQKSAMLASKWSGYILSDQSHETRSVKLTAPSGTIDQTNYEQTFVNVYGLDNQYIFIGGQLNDELTGGHENDMLIGGAGADVLTGKSGADIFVAGDDDVIIDYNPSENDVIDISHLLSGIDINLDNYLNIQNDGIDTLLKIDPNGNKDYVQEIKLSNTLLTNSDAYVLWANDQLRTGNIRPELTVHIQTINTSAIETLNQAAIARVYFSESVLPQGMSIPITLGGTATCETDYIFQAKLYNEISEKYEYVDIQSFIPVQLKSGDSHIEIKISPISDNTKEDQEDINIQILENKTYFDLAEDNQIQLNISDGPDIVSITKISSQVSENNTQLEGFILKREGSLDHPLVVKVNIQGTATNGIDYQYIPSEWTIPSGANQITMLLKPYVDSLIEIPYENIDISILQSDNYQTGEFNHARVTIEDMPIQIHLKAVQNIAERNWEIPATVHLIRSFSVNSDISVQLKFSGNAINGRDMEWLSDTITFGAGLLTVPIQIKSKALKNSTMDAIKTLKIEIIPQSPYTCTTPSNAEIYIVNEKINVKDWLGIHFPEHLENIDTILKQDTDMDGLSNFEEYAYGLDPKTRNMQQSIQKIFKANDHLILKVGRSLLASDVNYQVELSEDLTHWQTGDTHIELINAELINSRMWETWKSVKPVLPGKVQFMRLRVEEIANE
ncbi:Hemolysin-type calcium-binding region [Candidatus Magnetomorum sp. HK-1]|nr:Hemolysin-type calcium-binding region [Candidatus Magnetomorum sp. HK-1]